MPPSCKSNKGASFTARRGQLLKNAAELGRLSGVTVTVVIRTLDTEVMTFGVAMEDIEHPSLAFRNGVLDESS